MVDETTIDDLAAFSYTAPGATRDLGVLVTTCQGCGRSRTWRTEGRSRWILGALPPPSTKPAMTTAVPHSAQSGTVGVSGDPPDVTVLLTAAERLLGRWDGVGEQLCQVVDAITQHGALLLLHAGERTRGVRSESPAGARLYQIGFGEQTYGTLLVAPTPDAQESGVLALPDAQAQRLARLCGALICLLEQAALQCVLARHLAPEPLDALTPRQREILALIARGLSDDEMMDALHITSDTLRRHRCDLRARLGVHSDRDLPLAAYQYGLVRYITTEGSPSTAVGRPAK